MPLGTRNAGIKRAQDDSVFFGRAACLLLGFGNASLREPCRYQKNQESTVILRRVVMPMAQKDRCHPKPYRYAKGPRVHTAIRGIPLFAWLLA